MSNLNEVILSQFARVAGVGRAAVLNWRRLHGGLDATGGIEDSPTFPRGVAEQWLRDLGKLAEPGPRPGTARHRGVQRRADAHRGRAQPAHR